MGEIVWFSFGFDNVLTRKRIVTKERGKLFGLILVLTMFLTKKRIVTKEWGKLFGLILVLTMFNEEAYCN